MKRLLFPAFVATILGAGAPVWAASVSANLGIGVTQSQTITAVSLSNTSFSGGAASGTVVGAIGVAMSPAAPAFSGTLALAGANAANFQIVGSNLETKGVVPAGTYQISIVAVETGATGSPYTQAETITGTTASASTCPANDGSSGASAGTPQFPSLLSSYPVTIHSLGCKVAGVDYHVGLPSPATLSDPAASALPAGCSYNSNSATVNCNGNNITVSGYDFSLHGGVKLSFTGTGTVTKNNFALEPNCSDPVINFNISAGGTLGITYNNFDGGGAKCGTLTFGTMINGVYGNAAIVTLAYNYFLNTPQDLIDSRGPSSGSAQLIEEYNLYNGEGWQGHPDGNQLNGGNFTGNIIAFNTFWNPFNQATLVQPFHVEAQLTATVVNAAVYYNTMVTPGTCNSGSSYPTGCTVNFDIACKQDSGWVDVNNGFSAYGNYIDASGAIAALTNAYSCTNASFGSPYANYRMDTGKACAGTTCN